MQPHPALLLVVAALLVSALTLGPSADDPIVLSERHHHLGNDATPDWSEAPVDPEGAELELEFDAPALDGPTTLVLFQRSVGRPWHVELNGSRVATLDPRDELLERAYELPAGAVLAGHNVLRIVGDEPEDDITVGRLRLFPGDLRELYDLRIVRVHVQDAASGAPSPARVTVTTPEGELVELYHARSDHTAVRPGVCYTSGGLAAFEIPPGAYLIYATRGPEWSLARGELAVDGAEQELSLELSHEVSTPGYVACDTHVHTLTYSGHGDSSVEERMVTLAGEGVELAIATDHNHNTDYRPTQARLGLQGWFTPVVGNEVTTPIGHLNAFPLDPADEVPPYDLHDIATIVAGIRARGALAVVLNHPRWPDHERGPYGVAELDPFTGRAALEHPYDAVELINSETVEEDPQQLFTDWFALLNRGETVRAVGSSDSHTVAGAVGQGRTYLASSTDDPAAIDVKEAARSLVEGRSSIGMGIFATVDVNGGRMGDLVRPRDGRVEVELRVAAPSWIRPEVATVFVDGIACAELDVPAAEGPTDVTLKATLDAPPHDAYVVCLVRGAGAGGPWWPQLNDYTLAATNPVFVDFDGDGKYASPRATARLWLDRAGAGGDALAALVARGDEAVALQLLDLAREGWLREVDERVAGVVREAARTDGRVGQWVEALAPGE